MGRLRTPTLHTSAALELGETTPASEVRRSSYDNGHRIALDRAGRDEVVPAVGRAGAIRC
ncbi:MAG: hypothetical protein AAF713_08730 [Pseudomonadota bacterium]